jgi:hypothetical protein
MHYRLYKKGQRKRTTTYISSILKKQKVLSFFDYRMCPWSTHYMAFALVADEVSRRHLINTPVLCKVAVFYQILF